jgi:hypothetical protein
VTVNDILELLDLSMRGEEQSSVSNLERAN